MAQDQESGLSLVKIPGRDLPFLKLAAPDSLKLGQEVVMIASSGKNGRRVSGGYVSSLAGYDGEWEYMIDKSIRVTAFNPGFGGGTLANFRGELAGIVSLNLNEVGKFTMAIPIEYYRTYEQELKQYGQVRSRARRPWLGIYTQGVAGLVVIGNVTGKIRSRQEIYHEMWKKRPGERILFRVIRDDEAVDIEVIGGDRADRYRT